jgi:hypothetical protein
VNELLHTRLGFLIGLLIAAVVAAWWLGASRIALTQGGGTSAIAQSALIGLWLTRAMALAPFALRAGALGGARSALVASFALLLVSWPLVLAAWQASMLPATRLLLGEGALLAGGGLLALIGATLPTLFRSARNALIIATMLGVVISVATWSWGGAWMRVLP